MASFRKEKVASSADLGKFTAQRGRLLSLSCPNSHHHCLGLSHRRRKRQPRDLTPQEPTSQALHSASSLHLSTLVPERSRGKHTVSSRGETLGAQPMLFSLQRWEASLAIEDHSPVFQFHFGDDDELGL